MALGREQEGGGEEVGDEGVDGLYGRSSRKPVVWRAGSLSPEWERDLTRARGEKGTGRVTWCRWKGGGQAKSNAKTETGEEEEDGRRESRRNEGRVTKTRRETEGDDRRESRRAEGRMEKPERETEGDKDHKKEKTKKTTTDKVEKDETHRRGKGEDELKREKGRRGEEEEQGERIKWERVERGERDDMFGAHRNEEDAGREKGDEEGKREEAERRAGKEGTHWTKRSSKGDLVRGNKKGTGNAMDMETKERGAGKGADERRDRHKREKLAEKEQMDDWEKERGEWGKLQWEKYEWAKRGEWKKAMSEGMIERKVKVRHESKRSETRTEGRRVVKAKVGNLDWFLVGFAIACSCICVVLASVAHVNVNDLSMEWL